jgi:hypothetical protein
VFSITCPVAACKAVLVAGVRVCPFCRVTLVWDGKKPAVDHPKLGTGGAAILARDLSREPMPGRQTLEEQHIYRSWRATAAGAEVWMQGVTNTEFFVFPLRMRDAVVRTTWTARDDLAIGGVVFRRERLGNCYTQYLVTVRPGIQHVTISREVTGIDDKRLSSTTFVDTACKAVAPAGSPNEVAVAAYGGSIQLWINHTLAAAVYDPTLGIGAVGLMFRSFYDEARATFASIEIATVSS